MSQHGSIEIQFAFRPKRKTYPRPALPHNPKEGAVAPFAERPPRVSQVLALAIQLQEMLSQGEVRNCADLARFGGLTRERISQIMKLNWLAPDIQIEVLHLRPTPGARGLVSEVAVRGIAVRLSWAEQRELWLRLKQNSGLR
jgi:hypothetical protein